MSIPAKIISLEKGKAIAKFAGKKQKINTQLVKVKAGDYVIVSNGFAIKKIRKNEAEEILKIINMEV